ncbi:MAG: CPBP family intramembrane metalloprotease [Crocosphaera sp.]|nr:CPBP family intramembrane metalloprotease [Crocosphaera sp.]
MISGSLIFLIFLTEWIIGWLNILGFAWNHLSLYNLVYSVITELVTFGIIPAWNEELIYRGYILNNLRKVIGPLGAVLISSALFAGCHLKNPSVSFIAILCIFLGGIWFSCSLFLTKQLWLSIGLHTGWNFFEGAVFGFPVSGLNSFHIIQQTVSGRIWLTGGAFGPEGGFLGIFAILLGIAIVYVMGSKKFHIIPAKQT